MRLPCSGSWPRSSGWARSIDMSRTCWLASSVTSGYQRSSARAPWGMPERLRRRCPVLVLTESRDAGAPARALAAGAAAAVAKPFKPTVLARTVNELIDRRSVGVMADHSEDRGDEDLGVEQEERLEE